MPAGENVTKETVIERLKTVSGPDFSGNIVDLGMLSDIFIADGKVFFSITVPAARAQEMEPLRAAADRVVKSIPGVTGAVVTLTAEKRGGGMEAPVPPRPPVQRPAAAAPHAPHPAPASRASGKRGVPGIEAIIAVASGNTVYPLLMNSFRPVYTNLSGQFFRDREVTVAVHAYHRALAQAIEGGDGGKAKSVMTTILQHGEEHLRRMIGEENPAGSLPKGDRS